MALDVFKVWTNILLYLENQGIFETLISTIEHFAKDNKNYPTAKVAFSVLTRMVTAWGGSDGEQPTIPGFDRFMIERFSPLCWALPSNPDFKPKDAQGKQVLAEAATMQRAIYSKTGAQYVTWLRDVELRGMGMDEQSINEYLQALIEWDLRRFKQYFQVSVASNSNILNESVQQMSF